MSTRFDELAAQRDPLYAEMEPVPEFMKLKDCDRAAEVGVTAQWRRRMRNTRNQFTREIQYRALRNQGQPYYTEEQS